MKKLLFLLITITVFCGCEIFLKDVENINISVVPSLNSITNAEINSLTFTFKLETENTSDAYINLKSYKVYYNGVASTKDNLSGISLYEIGDSGEISGIAIDPVSAETNIKIEFYFETEQDVELVVITSRLTLLP